METESIVVKVELDDEDLAHFQEIKDFYGIKNNSEILRLCLTHAYRQLEKRRVAVKEVS